MADSGVRRPARAPLYRRAGWQRRAHSTRHGNVAHRMTMIKRLDVKMSGLSRARTP